jgi:hypothetical protein
MTSYFRVKCAEAPWGDYGDILINGLADPRYDDGKLTSLGLCRTGPFVPPITQPFGQIVIVDDLRRELEGTEFTGFEFVKVDLAKGVRCDWDSWDQNADEPRRYPDSGEPEDYIVQGSHDAELLEEIPTLWALSVKSTKDLQVDGSSSFYSDRHPGTDVAREHSVFWISEPLKAWLEERAGRWVEFERVISR